MPRTILAALAVLSLGGCFLLPKQSTKAGPPLIEPAAIKYNTVPIGRADISREINLYGQLVPLVSAEVYFKYQGGRIQRLAVRNGSAVSKGDLIAELNLGNTELQLEQRKILLEKAQVTYDMKKAMAANKVELQIAAMDVRLAELQLAELQEKVDGSRLLSPLTGVVSFIGVKEGKVVEPFAIVARVVDPSRLVLECKGGKDSDSFSFGTSVQVKLKNRIYTGKVIRSPRDAPDDANVEEKDKILVDIPGLARDTTMSDIATLTLTLEKRENAIVIPRNALHRYGDKSYINVLNEGLREERYIVTGVETASEIEVIDGVREGELLITN